MKAIDAAKAAWSKERFIKEGLLKRDEVKPLYDDLLNAMGNELSQDTLVGLRFRKLTTGTPGYGWWSDSQGYPVDDVWCACFEPLLDLLAQHEAAKTLKARYEDEDLFVESRTQGEDLHIILGMRDGSSEKAHVIIDHLSGEVRVKDKGTVTDKFSNRIEAVLTLKDGTQIRTARGVVEKLD